MPHSTSSSAVKLNNQNLPQLSAQQGDRQVICPPYDRDGVKEGIVHIGVGGFHRAHLAVYVDNLMGQHNVRDWGICGIGLKPWDSGIRDALTGQDCMYTVIERSAKGSSARVIGSINSFLYAPGNSEAVIAKMAHPDTHIVSLTITESGYYYNENTHELEVEHPDIVSDLANEGSPCTTFGYLYEALERRYKAGLKPFTVLSCDNMQKNGTITRNMLTSFARLRNPEIADWIVQKGGFPNSMVDRITPRTADVDKTNLAEEFGVEDAWPVVTEPFMQWVVEDKFADGRPPFEKVGVQVVTDVEDVEQFEKIKLRLLNASHTSMAYAGYLQGIEYVHEIIENPVWRKYLENMMHEEVQPLLPKIPGVDIDEYINTLIKRFSNPTIMDQIIRLCLNGSGKLPQFIMPSVAENIWVQGPTRRLAFSTASWFRFLNGVDEKGNSYEIDDPMAKELQALAREGGPDPGPLMSVKSLFGDDLRNDKVFMDHLREALAGLYRDGAEATIAKYVD